jgi:hypothetical protein
MYPAIRPALRSRGMLGVRFFPFFGFFCFQRRCGYEALNPDYSLAGLSPSEANKYLQRLELRRRSRGMCCSSRT